MRSLFALAVVLGVAVDSARAGEPVSPIEGCEVYSDAPDERLVQCSDGIVALQKVGAPGVRPEGFLDTVIALVQLDAGHGVQLEPAEIEVAGAKRRGHRVTGDTTVNPKGRSGFVVVLPLEDRPMVLTCLSASQETVSKRCPKMLEYLARQRPEVTHQRTELSRPEDAALFGGAPNVPETCKRVDPHTIRCQSSALTWGLVRGPEPLTQLTRSMREAAPADARIEESERACRIAGMRTRCRVLEAQRHGMDEGTVVLGTVERQGASFLIECRFAAAPSEGPTPAPCDQILSLDAEDPARAAVRYQRACDKQDWDGCAMLGVLYENGAGVPRDEARAAALFKSACEDHKNARGCKNLGVMYDDGAGVAQDYAKAIVLYERACAGKDAEGCGNLGLMYWKGHGVKTDEARAATLFAQACGADVPLSCSFLGLAYEGSAGVKKDLARAAELFRKGCDGGDPLGCSFLGSYYEDGAGGVRKDEARAAEVYRKACDGGESHGCTAMGALYRDGRGIARDSEKALEYFRLGCRGGDEKACAMLKK